MTPAGLQPAGVMTPPTLEQEVIPWPILLRPPEARETPPRLPAFPASQRPLGQEGPRQVRLLRQVGRRSQRRTPPAALWADQKDDLLAGRTPRANRDGLTVGDLCNHFLTAKEQQRDAGDITPRTFADYFTTAQAARRRIRPNRLVDDLAADDFQALRASSPSDGARHRLGNEVQRVRTVFKYGYDAGLIDKPVRFGPTFKRPTTRIMRAHRQKKAPRMFEAAELRTIIDAAAQPLKAMILLGINCGFGNHDCGTLPLSALDLDGGWVNYPATQDGDRATLPAVAGNDRGDSRRQSPNDRPQKSPEHAGLVFVTKYGAPWAKDIADNPVTKEFRKLLDTLKLHRPGLGFYALRHTFETIAGGSRDQVAVNHIMGHVDASMAAAYREQIDDDRLHAVVDPRSQVAVSETEG